MKKILNNTQIDYIFNLAIEAGEIAKKAFLEKKFTIKKKDDNSQVTSADIAVSIFIHEKLTKYFPTIPVICEENTLRQIDEKIFFLIDPIDGTSSFVSGNNEFSINIALVRNNKSEFGLTYAPLFENGKMIFNDEDNNLIKFEAFNKQRVILNPNNDSIKGLRITTSNRSEDDDIKKYVQQFYPDYLDCYEVERLSSAIKFFRIVEGKSNLYLHFRKSMEWDTASGQALVEISGGKVKNLFCNGEKFSLGDSMEYKKPNFSNQAFVVENVSLQRNQIPKKS